MKLIPCPLNGLRPQTEFHYGGPLRPMPDPDAVDDDTWAEYLYHRAGAPAVTREWWYHVPSGFWFIAERDTVTDTFIRSYPYSDVLQSDDLRSDDERDDLHSERSDDA